MAITNYQGGADTIFDYRNINRVAERELARKATVAQSKAKAAEDQAKEIAAMLAKINPDGLRDADLGAFSKQYGEVQTFAAEVRAADTIEKRAIASAKFNQGVQNIGLLINGSKNQSKTELQVGGTLGGANTYRVSDSQRKRYGEILKTPTSELSGVNYQEEFRLGVRPEHMMNVDKTIEESLSKAASNFRERVEIGTIKKNGITKVQFQDQSTVTPQQAYAGYVQGYTSDPEYREGVDLQAQRAGLDVNTFLQQKAAQRAPLLGERGATSLSDFTPPKSGSGSGSEKESPLQTGGVIPVKSMNYGNSNLELYNYTPLAQPVQRVAGTFTMQDAQGNIIKTNKSTAEYEVVGVAKVPVAVRNMNLYKKGAVVTPRFAKANPSMVEFKELAIVSNKTNMSIDGRKYTVGNDFIAEFSDVVNANSLSSTESKSLSFARKEKLPSWYTDSNKSNTPKPASSGGAPSGGKPR